MDCFERVRCIVVDHLGTKENDVTPDKSFIDDLGADSLDLVELIMAFEEEFSVEVTDSEAGGWFTVGDAVRYAERINS